MSEHGNPGAGPRWRGVAEEEAVKSLLEQAGPRPAPPEDELAAIAEVARAAWRRRYGGAQAPAEAAARGPAIAEPPTGEPATVGPAAPGPARPRIVAARRARRWLPLAAAAVLAVTAGLAWWLTGGGRPPAAGAALAAIEVWSGTVRIRPPGAGGFATLDEASAGRALAAGTAVETGPAAGGEAGRLALRTAGGASLRLDAGSRLRLDSAERVTLDRGALYVDSGPGVGDLEVATAAGVFREVGTQFEVRTGENGAAAGTRLRVREGRVALERGAEPALAAAGEELTVRADGGLDRNRAALSGPDWEWVLAAAPMLDIEGRTVREFLDWYARETGLAIELADAEAAARADATVLHGSIAHLTIAEAPAAVLASGGLGHRIGDGTVAVFVTD